MKPREFILNISSVIAAAVVFASWNILRAADEPVHGQAPAQASYARYPRNAQEFDQLFNQVKNWGRWGSEDQFGSMNLITDAKRKQALLLARLGRSVSLAHTYLTADDKDPRGDLFDGNGTPFEHVMNEGYNTDSYKVDYHGHVHSHFDTLCHASYKDKVYNGYPTSVVNTEKGCTRLDVLGERNGIITRGILIDIPRLKGVRYLEPGTPVFTEDIEAWEKKAGVKIGSGDAILLRTGRWMRWAKVGPWALGEREAGFHASIAPFLKQRGVAVIGSDDSLDVLPSFVDDVAYPVHTLSIPALGIPILDSQDLEELAETAASLHRWEFALVVAPLTVRGGTGSPINALAIF